MGVQSKIKLVSGATGLIVAYPRGYAEAGYPGGYAALISKLNKRSLTTLNKIRVCLLSS